MTDRDRQRMAGVHPDMVAKLEPIIDDLDMFVVVGVRTSLEQGADYAKGRTAPGPGVDAAHPLGRTVTNCDGFTHRSPHQVREDGFGHAVDIAFIPTHDRRDPFDPHWPWETFGERLEAVGLKWGGRFSHPVDLDHAEMP